MSLQAAAQHLAAHGRGKDSQLVHMSPREVKSLQDLARAHGGSLTTNPSTGLPEAGFLEAVLPAAAGFAMTGLSGGAINPMTAGLIMGGLGYAATGSLTKGLTMGLGAYGGAGLGAGVTPEMLGRGTEESIGNAINKVPVEDAVPKPVEQFTRISPQYVDLSGAMSSPVSQGAVKATALPEMMGIDPSTLPGYSLMDPGAVPTSAQPFTNVPFEPAPGVTPDTYGQNFPKGPTSASLKPEMGLTDVLKKNATMSNVGMAAAPLIGGALQPKPLAPITTTSTLNPVYAYNPGTATPTPTADPYGVEQSYFPTAGYTRVAAEGGVMRMAEGGPAIQGIPSHGPVEQMSIANSIGQNTGFPQAAISRGAYATPWQTPISRNMLEGAADTGVNPITGNMNFATGGITGSGNLDLHIPIELGGGASNGFNSPTTTFESANSSSQPVASSRPIFSGYNNDSSNILGDTFVGTKAFSGNTQEGLSSLFSLLGGKAMANGGLSDLGGYSDGGRLLRGPGDGVSDSIPAVIGKKQPARLADGEFVVPARIVSEIGNGSTEAGARKLYAMMDRVQQARGKTVGKGKVAKNTRAEKYLPA